MATETQNRPPILTIAWTRFAQMDAISSFRTKPHMRLRRWISILGVLATLFAILTEIYPQTFPAYGSAALKVLLILTPIAGSLLAAFVNRFYASGDWLTTRAGAEEIKKEIYFFRTIFKNTPNRREYLEKRLAEIQRTVFRGLNGELLLSEYTGPLPPHIDEANSDPGFNDMTGEEYFRLRLQSQLNWHIGRIKRVNRERVRLQIFILLAGAGGAFLAAMGGPFSLWVALTASLAASLIGWQELRNLDPIVKNYSKLITELTILANHWEALEPHEHTDSEFFAMVTATEEVLWNQNIEYIKSMQEALAQAKLDEANLIEGVLRQAVEADARFKQSLAEAATEQVGVALTEGHTAMTATYRETFGRLAEEASSELVQQELAAMRAAAGRALRLNERLDAIATEFAHLKPGPNTPKEELNALISRFPPTGEIKG